MQIHSVYKENQWRVSRTRILIFNDQEKNWHRGAIHGQNCKLYVNSKYQAYLYLKQEAFCLNSYKRKLLYAFRQVYTGFNHFTVSILQLTANITAVSLLCIYILACYTDVLAGASVYALCRYCVLLQNYQTMTTSARLEKVNEHLHEALLTSNHQQPCYIGDFHFIVLQKKNICIIIKRHELLESSSSP